MELPEKTVTVEVTRKFLESLAELRDALEGIDLMYISATLATLEDEIEKKVEEQIEIERQEYLKDFDPDDIPF